jgi:hypothetical protein
VVRTSFKDGGWHWAAADARNSISDAEQLLCLLYPATELGNLTLEDPDSMAEDVAGALAGLGDPSSIPQRVVDVLADYIRRNTDNEGEPSFVGGSYLRTDPGLEITEEQLKICVVDSYSMSVTLCLAALGFLSVFKPLTLKRQKLYDRVVDLEQAFRDRLTCAMIGLLRSFVVNTVRQGEPEHTNMLRMMNQGAAPDKVVLEQLRERLVRVRARLLDDVRIGVNVEVGLDDERRLFECGWGWGIVRNATDVKIPLEGTGRTNQPVIGTQEGIADPRPYLYSTVLALDGINDLRSARTRELGLLTDEQRTLNEALQLRWDLTQRYWGTIARFGDGKWPLEDIPWQTSDGEEKDYFSLLVSAVLVQDLANREATDDDLNRLVLIFESLAQRGRITRRVTRKDPAVEMHVPGERMRLGGTDKLGPQLYWTMADFAPLLLKRALQSARLSANVDARDRLMEVAEATMDHLNQRRISHREATGLWDDPGEVLFPDDQRAPVTEPSWYHTERVVEALVMTASTFAQPPLRSAQLRVRALDVLHEADHLLNREMLDAGADDNPARRATLTTIEATLVRARRIVIQQPGTANALANEALRKLDELAVAHLDATRSI